MHGSGWTGKGVELAEAVSGSPRATTTAGHQRRLFLLAPCPPGPGAFPLVPSGDLIAARVEGPLLARERRFFDFPCLIARSLFFSLSFSLPSSLSFSRHLSIRSVSFGLLFLSFLFVCRFVSHVLYVRWRDALDAENEDFRVATKRERQSGGTTSLDALIGCHVCFVEHRIPPVRTSRP